jgi:SAM-dependent methyltransferase
MTGIHRLDIGCGKARKDGFVGVDLHPGSDADVLCDIGKGLPFRDGVFSEVHLSHVFEHVEDPVHLMEEIRRVSLPGALVTVRGPHFSSPHLAWGDPTHRRALSMGSFLFFEGGWYGSDRRFAIRSIRLLRGETEWSSVRGKPWRYPFVPVNRALERIVNRSRSWVNRYERTLSGYIRFPEILVVLEVVKGSPE